MLLRFTTLAAATLVTMAHAQKVYEIDPETVDILQRENWCMNSQRACPLICSQYENTETLVNTCDPEYLTYGCLCGDNIKPNMSEYSLTIPYFTCMEWGNQCVTGCGSDSSCATSCREDNPCGAQDPKRVNATTTTMAPGTSSTSTETEEEENTIFTDTPGSDNSDSSSSSNSNSNSNNGGGDNEGAASLLTLGSTYGLTVVMGGIFLGFALF